MDAGNILLIMIVGSLFLTITLFHISKRFSTLNISRSDLASEYLSKQSPWNSERLKPLCPKIVQTRWKRLIVLESVGIFVLSCCSFIFLAMPDKIGDQLLYQHLDAMQFIIGSAFLFHFVLNRFNRHRLNTESVCFMDGSKRWETKFDQSSPMMKLFTPFLFLLPFVVFAVLYEDAVEGGRLRHEILRAFVLLALFVFVFRSEQTALGKAGLFDRGSFVPWSRILEYRWFEDRSALLLIVDRWSTKSPMVIFPVQEELRTDVEELLQEYAPDKQREDVEPALEKLDSQDSATAATSSA